MNRRDFCFKGCVFALGARWAAKIPIHQPLTTLESLSAANAAALSGYGFAPIDEYREACVSVTRPLLGVNDSAYWSMPRQEFGPPVVHARLSRDGHTWHDAPKGLTVLRSDHRELRIYVDEDGTTTIHYRTT